MTHGFDHPYQEFNSKRALFHHLRVDHGWEDADDLPSRYLDTEQGRSQDLVYGPLLADHEDFHSVMAEHRGET